MPNNPCEGFLDNHFVYFRPTSQDLAGTLAAEYVGDIADLARLMADVQDEHEQMMASVIGDVAQAVAVAPNEPILRHIQFDQKASFVLAALRLLGQKADEVNHARSRSPRDVDALNQAYREMRHGHFGVDPESYTDDEDSQERYREHVRGEREYAVSLLCLEYAHLDGLFDETATEVAAMIGREPNEGDLRTMFRAGVVSPGELTRHFPSFSTSFLTYDDWKQHFVRSLETGGLPDRHAIPEGDWTSLVNDPDAMIALGEMLDVGAALGSDDGSRVNVFDVGSEFEWIVTYANAIRAHPEWNYSLPPSYLDHLRTFIDGAVDAHGGDLDALAGRINAVEREVAENLDESDAPQRFGPFHVVFADGLRALADTSIGGDPELLPEAVQLRGLQASIDSLAPPREQVQDFADAVEELNEPYNHGHSGVPADAAAG